MKRTITVLLIALMLICCTNITAYALTTPSPGDTLSINGDAVRITQAGTYIITGSGSTTNTITVDPNIEGEVNITLNDVHIDVSATNACAFSIGAGTTVNLTITGTNLLKSGFKAGLHVPSVTVLKIDGAGSLEAAGKGGIHFGPAGIGGNANTGCGDITINGGTVTATGGMNQVSAAAATSLGAILRSTAVP